MEGVLLHKVKPLVFASQGRAHQWVSQRTGNGWAHRIVPNRDGEGYCVERARSVTLTGYSYQPLSWTRVTSCDQ